MNVPRLVSRVGLWVAICCMVMPMGIVAADSAPDASLRIREINITGDEFVVLQNVGTQPIHLDEYWLGYVGDDTATYVVPTQQLPAAVLMPPTDEYDGQSIILNNGMTSTCDAAIVDELGFSGLSNTKGVLQLRHLTNDGATSTFTTVDSVAWGKLPADQIQIADEKGLADGSTPVWYKDAHDASSIWRVGDLVGCDLTLLPVPSDGSDTPAVITWEITGDSPPSVYVGAISTKKTSTPSIPSADKGLKAPQLSEILPNPASPQTDAADEFIELYNPNAKSFDLSDFILQTASTSSSTTHTYHIPEGIKIAAGSFLALKSSQTHLSMSNSGGQVWLVDPLGTTLDTCDPYATAKDGQAWVDAGGKWQWTLMPTPGLTNKVATPISGTSSSKTATVNGKKVTAVNGATTGTTLGATTSAAVSSDPLSIHPLTLAIIITAAILYGAYEYRHDLALKYRQFRRNRAARG